MARSQHEKIIMKTVTKFIFGLPKLALLLGIFAGVQNVQAEPNEADPIVNMAEEDDAVVQPGSDTVEAAMGQAANTPNQRVINFNIKKPLECAGGDVILSGNVLVTFKHTS